MLLLLLWLWNKPISFKFLLLNDVNLVEDLNTLILWLWIGGKVTFGFKGFNVPLHPPSLYFVLEWFGLKNKARWNHLAFILSLHYVSPNKMLFLSGGESVNGLNTLWTFVNAVFRLFNWLILFI